MPLYEYRCNACGYSFEKIQSFSAKPETECPKCHGELIRPVTAPALRFEGAGWYVNDYAGKGAAKTGQTATSADTASSSESKSEAAPGSGDSKATPAAPAAAPAASTPSTSSAPSTGS